MNIPLSMNTVRNEKRRESVGDLTAFPYAVEQQRREIKTARSAPRGI
jgi:hypothetical protein